MAFIIVTLRLGPLVPGGKRSWQGEKGRLLSKFRETKAELWKAAWFIGFLGPHVSTCSPNSLLASPLPSRTQSWEYSLSSTSVNPALSVGIHQDISTWKSYRCFKLKASKWTHLTTSTLGFERSLKVIWFISHPLPLMVFMEPISSSCSPSLGALSDFPSLERKDVSTTDWTGVF